MGQKPGSRPQATTTIVCNGPVPKCFWDLAYCYGGGGQL